jgi:hypothetical protein
MTVELFNEQQLADVLLLSEKSGGLGRWMLNATQIWANSQSSNGIHANATKGLGALAGSFGFLANPSDWWNHIYQSAQRYAPQYKLLIEESIFYGLENSSVGDSNSGDPTEGALTIVELLKFVRMNAFGWILAKVSPRWFRLHGWRRVNSIYFEGLLAFQACAHLAEVRPWIIKLANDPQIFTDERLTQEHLSIILLCAMSAFKLTESNLTEFVELCRPLDEHLRSKSSLDARSPLATHFLNAATSLVAPEVTHASQLLEALANQLPSVSRIFGEAGTSEQSMTQQLEQILASQDRSRALHESPPTNSLH